MRGEPDRIRITGISVSGVHGVLPSERTRPQRFVVDLEVEVDPARDDALSSTLDYDLLGADAVAVVAGESVNLIETLAERIAATVLERPGARAVRVTVHKPEAPLGYVVEDVSITIARRQS